MTVMSGNLYRALRQANVPDEMAQKAAEEVASQESSLQQIKIDIALIRADVSLLKWSNGLIVAGVIALVMKSFF
jgi:hypothetical protein